MNNRNEGVYVMQVAANLTGMHPQTLRKYEREGLLAPSRRYMARLYSDEDIDRLKMIKQLVDEKGLNIAGIKLFLRIRDKLLEMKDMIASASVGEELEKTLIPVIDELLEI